MRERLHQFCYTRADFQFDWYSGTGAGGQYRNKHQNSLRLTHIPSGIMVTAADNRDRPTNLRNAWARMKPKLLAWIKAQIGEADYPRVYDVIRTYHHADNRVLDHSSGLQIAWTELDKRFDDLVCARAKTAAEGPVAQSGRV